MAFAVPTTASVGSPISAAQWNVMVASFSAMQMTAYTPVLTATTTAPGLGSSPTVAGFWAQFGKLIYTRMDITFGSSPTAGSGTYLLALPQTASATSGPENLGCRLFDASSGNAVFPNCVLTDSTHVQLQYTATTPTGALTNVTNAIPWVWAAGDLISVQLLYITP